MQSRALIIGDRRHPGIVLDISETGLFIQTSASPPPGERARLTLRRPDGTEVEVEASVARRYVIPRRLVSVARGGIGLRVESASEEEAKTAASAKLDEGWEILAVDPVAA